MTQTDRPCALGEKCGEAVIDPSDPSKRIPPYSTRNLCATDTLLLSTVLLGFPRIYEQLRVALGDKTRGVRVRMSNSTSPQTPIRLDIEETMAKVSSTLLMWEDRVREVHGLPARKDVALSRPSVLVELSCAYLGAMMAQFIDLPDSGADGALELMELYRVCRSRLGLTARNVPLPAPCGVCGTRRLVRWDGTAGLSDDAYCEECSTSYTTKQYAELVELYTRPVQTPK